MPFLKEEKSEHERARTSMLAVQLCCARHCELPLSKMGNKGLFPGVAVPLAFFCTLFFRHRKKSVSAPWDGKSLSAPESARHSPPGDLLTAKLLPNAASRGLSSGQAIGALIPAAGIPLHPSAPSPHHPQHRHTNPPPNRRKLRTHLPPHIQRQFPIIPYLIPPVESPPQTVFHQRDSRAAQQPCLP